MSIIISSKWTNKDVLVSQEVSMRFLLSFGIWTIEQADRRVSVSVALMTHVCRDSKQQSESSEFASVKLTHNVL